MNPSASPNHKRDNGDDMSQFREVVDDETGERIRVRVDTTKSAKKRAKKVGGAQWQPTAGQIKAAEIWNKQEEKIKKDKENEEKRRKNTIRQAAKDAKVKEAQEEMLRRGKITVEDTWGKVSASQNRLNKFFVIPKKLVIQQENFAQVAEAEDEDEDVLDWADSPLEDVLSATKVTTEQPTAQVSTVQPPSRPDIEVEKVVTQMLPPPLPVKNVAQKSQHPIPTSVQEEQFVSSDSVPVFLSTQDVSQLFADIGSQDLEDDLAADFNDSFSAETTHAPLEPQADRPKEHSRNSPPVQATSTKRHSIAFEEEEFDDSDVDDETLLYFAATQRVVKRAKQDPSGEPNSPSSTTTAVLSQKSPKSPENNTISPTISTKPLKRSFGGAADSFAFTDIDDNDLIQCVEDFENTDIIAEVTQHDINSGDDNNQFPPPSSSESYFQDDRIDLNDEDLLKAVEAVEAIEEQEATTENQAPFPSRRQPQIAKKRRGRRVLPWDKFPEIYAIAEGRREDISMSPSMIKT